MRLTILNQAIANCVTDRCPCSRYMHYCIAFRGKKILATGSNCVCKLSHRYSFDDSLHAEPSCLAKLKDQKKSFDILVIRMNVSGTRLLSSRPCRSCSIWLNLGFFPLKRVYFSTDDGGISSLDKKDLIKGSMCSKTFLHHDDNEE